MKRPLNRSLFILVGVCVCMACGDEPSDGAGQSAGTIHHSDDQTAGMTAGERIGLTGGDMSGRTGGVQSASLPRAGASTPSSIGGFSMQAGRSTSEGGSTSGGTGVVSDAGGGDSEARGGDSAAGGGDSAAGEVNQSVSDDDTPMAGQVAGMSADAGGEQPIFGGMPRPACDPPLSISPNRIYRATFDLVTFRAEGGAGGYRYTLAANGSGAILNSLTGVYLAGETRGVQDVIEVTDVSCSGSASAEVFVVSDLVVEPSQVEVSVSGTVPFNLSGGSGEFEVDFIENNSGAQVSHLGQYQAGDRPGTDVLQVRDPRTGLVVEVIVQVAVDATLSVDEPQVYLPLGSTVDVRIEGGSGHLLAVADNPVAHMTADGLVTAVGAGQTRLVVVDRYTRMEAFIDVQVSEAVQVPLTRMGRGSNDAVVKRAGDLNGDGFLDVIVAMSELSQRYVSDGIVAVYAGTENGLEPTPVRTFSGRARDDRFGRAVELGDFNGDSVADLAIGAINDDERGGNAGAVLIYHGRPAGFFEDEPSLKLLGHRSGDQFGQALAACDFNGDGFVDLAVSSQRYEKRERDLGLNDQGGVAIYLGSENGLAERPANIIDGHDFDADGELVPAAEIRIGVSMAAGYIDADNACDLVVGTTNRNFPQRGRGGMVQVFQGLATPDEPDSLAGGGLSELPVRIIYGDEADVNDGYLGRRIAVDDLNGDGLAEIVIAQHGYDGPNGNNSGQVRVFAGGPLDGPLRAAVTVADADWSWLGLSGADEAGIGLGVGDYDGDGLADLVIGAWRGEGANEDAEPNTGAVYVLLGREGQWPDVTPIRHIARPGRDQYFGESVGILGDLNGDGQSELGVVAGRGAQNAVRQAQTFLVSGANGMLMPLDLPGRPAGHRVGWRVDVADFNRDGRAEVLIGAPDAAIEPSKLTAGLAFLAGADDQGRYSSATIEALGHNVDHTGGDFFGHGVRILDFDGDGQLDVAVSAVNDEKPNNLDASLYTVDPSCERNPNSGAIFIYRTAHERAPDGRPDFIIYGDQRNIHLDALASADVNGDGRDDLIAGSHLGDAPGRDSGSFRVYLGRVAPAPDTTTVICDVNLAVEGSRNGAHLGRAAVGLGDLDGDGCEEFAVGEPNRRRNADSNSSDGGVWIVYGWAEQAGGCARVRSSYSLVTPALNDVRLGTSVSKLESGPNGAAWLAVGAPFARRPEGNVRTGAVYLIDFERLSDFPKFDFNVTDEPGQLLVADENVQVIWGQDAEERFGTSLAGGANRLVVAHQYRAYGQALRVGGATIFEAREQSIQKVASIVGETFGFESGLGIGLALDNETNTLAIGAQYGQASGAQAGSVYVFKLEDSQP
ncbi:MAG: FG-GAP-like repeat-containing protein [Myxococcota bacterium]|nr:FG-GAP-like repeat-containing protein [Myxococcota bacterium]